MTKRAVDPERFSALEIETVSHRLRESLPPPSKSKRAPSKQQRLAILAEATDMIQTNDFRRLSPRHLVGVWAWCHEKTYGVAPPMTGVEWRRASMAAGSLLRQDFDGKVETMIPFLKWTWAEEQRQHAWRRQNGRATNPLGWRLQFSSRHVVKWRANQGTAELQRRKV